jgi:hypothetical protein
MNKIKTAIICCIIFPLLVGCAGRKAHPINIQQLGDSNKNCEALMHEMMFIQNEINRLLPKTDKSSKNVAIGVAGLVFLPAIAFMDLSKAEEIEIDALRQRYNHLLSLSLTKKCSP